MTALPDPPLDPRPAARWSPAPSCSPSRPSCPRRCRPPIRWAWTSRSWTSRSCPRPTTSPRAPARACATTFDPAAELDRVRADVSFWADRLEADPANVVAAVKLADADAARGAPDRRRDRLHPGRWPRPTPRSRPSPRTCPRWRRVPSTLVALHRFAEARDAARTVLARDPGNPVAVGVIGDAIARARRPRRRRGRLPGAPARRRRQRLARPGRAAGVRPGRSGRRGCRGRRGGRCRARRGPRGRRPRVLPRDARRHADRDRRRGRRARGVRRRRSRSGPDLPAALVGLARLDAAEGRLDDAIAGLDAAIAAVPAPDWLARRSDLLERRGGAGDADAAAADRATIEAIASLAGEAGSRLRPGARPLSRRPRARPGAGGPPRARRAGRASRRLRLRRPRMGAGERGRRRRRPMRRCSPPSPPARRTPDSGITLG